jgi:hypothetical protein
MLRKIIVVCLMLACWTGLAPSAVRAADTVYTILIDGRPMTANAKDTGGLSHDGVVFVDVVELTRAYSGLLTFANSGRTMTISIRKRTAIFTKGRPFAVVNGAAVKLPAAPFIYAGDFYVPITAFARLTHSKVTIDQPPLTANLISPGSSATSTFATPKVRSSGR